MRGPGSQWYLDIEDAGDETVTWIEPPAGQVVKAARTATIEVTNDAGEPRRKGSEASRVRGRPRSAWNG